MDKENFGYCQQGLSVAFAKDNKYVLFGVPGAYEWKGTLLSYASSKTQSWNITALHIKNFWCN